MASPRLAKFPSNLLLKTLKKVDAARTLHRLFFTCNWMQKFLEENRMALTHLVGHVKFTNGEVDIQNDFLALDSEEREILSQMMTSEKLEMSREKLFASLHCSYVREEYWRVDAVDEKMWEFILELCKAFKEVEVAFVQIALPDPPEGQKNNAQTIVSMLKPKRMVVEESCYALNYADKPWFSECDDIVLIIPFIDKGICSEFVMGTKNVCITHPQEANGEYFYYVLNNFYTAFHNHEAPRLQNFEVLYKDTNTDSEVVADEELMGWFDDMGYRAVHTERECQWTAGTYDLERNVIFLCRSHDQFVLHQYHDTKQRSVFYRMTVIKSLEDLKQWKNKDHYKFMPGPIERMAKFLEPKVLEEMEDKVEEKEEESTTEEDDEWEVWRENLERERKACEN